MSQPLRILRNTPVSTMAQVEPSREPPVYYLVAPAGFPNFGDELILSGWLRYLSEVAPTAAVWVDTHSPGPAQMLFGDAHPRLRFTDTLWRLSWEARSDDPWVVASWMQKALDDPGMAPRWLQGVIHLRHVDIVHVVGGGYINAIWPHHLGLLAGAAAAAKLSGGRAAMTGQGLVPESQEAVALLRALVDRFDVVEVRDEPSAKLLGIERGIDDAFLALGGDRFTTPEQVWPDDAPPEVMMCLQSDMNDVGCTRVAGAALSMLRAWRVPPERVCIIEGIPRVDREVFALFEHEVPGARFYPFGDVWTKGLPLAPEQTWISTRFHMHMAAASVGANGVAVAVKSDYYTHKHRSLIEIGSGWTLLEDLDDVPVRPGCGAFSEETLDRLRHAKAQVAERIYRAKLAPSSDEIDSPELFRTRPTRTG